MQSREELLVLLIEDDPDLMELEQLLLESEDFLVVTARDGHRGLRLLQVIQPDIIVTDMMMPVLDGFGFMKQYKERPGADVPIVAVSAFEPYLEQAIELGATAGLQKPLEMSKLTALIRDIVRGESVAARQPGPQSTAEEESARLRAIFDLRLDQPAPETSIQTFVDSVALHFDVPISLLSVVTEDQQFWSASCGLPQDLEEARGGPRSESFCTHAVAARAALVVQDTAANPFFRDNPLVTRRGLRFYAGVPLIARHGEALGTLCLLDYQARTFTHFDLELLGVFGNRILAELEWRERRQQSAAPPGAFRYLEYIDTELDIFGKASFMQIAEIEGARAAELKIPIACAILAVPYRRLTEVAEQLRARSSLGLIGRLGHARLGWIVPAFTAADAHAAAKEIAGPHGFAESVELGRFSYGVRTALRQLELGLGDAGLA